MPKPVKATKTRTRKVTKKVNPSKKTKVPKERFSKNYVHVINVTNDRRMKIVVTETRVMHGKTDYTDSIGLLFGKISKSSARRLRRFLRAKGHAGLAGVAAEGAV